MYTYFHQIEPIKFEGKASSNPMAFKYYDPDKLILGKKMAEHLRVSVCLWHTLCWQGRDSFGDDTFNRPWHRGSQLEQAQSRVDAAIEFTSKLNAPFISFHDEDILPFRHDTIQHFFSELDHMLDYVGEKMQSRGIGLLLGTSNLFSHPCFTSGAATSPYPEVFAFAAAKVKNMMEKTKALNGQNYVLWGGRDGYNSLLNTDLPRELDQLGRFVSMAVEHKHKIGYTGALLIEPKPCEPCKHQYDFDVATVYGFLQKYGLEKEVQVNIEANHATLAGHSFEHEVAYACALGIWGVSMPTAATNRMAGILTSSPPISVS
jgi:D-xylose isomerase (EC 5.3.1.5)